jgi:MFS family permease
MRSPPVSTADAQRISTLDFLRAHPKFTRYQIARFAAVSAWQMQSVGVGWLVYQRTHAALALGMVGAVQFAPAMLFALFGGLVADRFERRRVVAWGHLLLLGISAALSWVALHAELGVAPIYALLVCIGVVRSFVGPASQALAPTLVPVSAFPRAVGLSSILTNTALLLGPAVGGQLYGAFGVNYMQGARILFLNCAGLFAITVALTATMPVTSMPERSTEAPWQRLVAGIRYVRVNRDLLGSISLDLFAVLLGGAVALLPVYARDILHVGGREFGWLRSAEAFGSIATAVVLAAKPLTRHAGIWMFAAVMGFGLCTIAFGLSTHYWLSMVLLTLLGAFDMVSVAVRSSLVQLRTPDVMRGRVSAVSMIFITASNELGQFESGVTAAWWGTVPSVVVGGVCTCGIVVLWAYWFPELRNFRSVEATGDDRH